MNPRAAAVEVLFRIVLAGESLARALPATLSRIDAAADKAAVQELVYGVCRWHLRLEPLVRALLRRPLKSRDRDLGLLLEIGLYQLLYQRTPGYAAVDGAVAAVRDLGKGWAAGLVNAVLRGFLRRREALLAAVDADPATRLAHPPWLVEVLRGAYPRHWEAVCAAGNARPPMTLRVNLRRLSREDYQQHLAAQGLLAAPHPGVETALTLDTPTEVTRLPGFAEGWVSVQDAAPQLAAPLLAAEPGMRVLDACAAPGGKTAHLLERAGGELELDAVELDPRRVGRLRENLRRLGLRARVHVGDAARPQGWWDGRPYDRILLDAPCSATGVIRRNPDIKLHRSEEDVKALAGRQYTLLGSLWPLLRPGGMLLYATCSVLPQENEQVVERFVAGHTDAELDRFEADWGHSRPAGRQILPGESDMDGFFYARLKKR